MRESMVTYGRRKRRCCRTESNGNSDEDGSVLRISTNPQQPAASAALHISGSLSHHASKRVKLKQYFLDFGQVDFSYSTCKICGLLYARGHGDDEKLHAVFHTSYLKGVQFKGWQRERLIVKYDKDDERIILILHSDPIQHQIKVKELMNIMEKELGLEVGWLLRERCKVFVYISLKKIVGCAVTEPINRAFPVLPEKLPITTPDVRNLKVCNPEAYLTKNISSAGEDWRPSCKSISMEDEKASPKSRQDCCSTVVAMAATCGIRGLWVSKAERRRGIATKLIDAVRSSFIYGLVLDTSQFAFSQPTPDGKAFATKYCKTDRFLVYS